MPPPLILAQSGEGVKLNNSWTGRLVGLAPPTAKLDQFVMEKAQVDVSLSLESEETTPGESRKSTTVTLAFGREI